MPGQREPDAKINTPPGAADAGSSASNAQQAGEWYRVWFLGGSDVGHLPFYLHLPARPNRGTAIINGGSHRVEAEARWYGSEATVNLPLYRTRMFFRQDASGGLAGHLMSMSPVLEETASLHIQAVPVPEPDEAKLFPDAAFCGASADAAPPPSLPVGKWLTSFEGLGEVEILIEEKAPQVLKATVKFIDGTVVALVGNVFGNRVCLASFDGVSPFLAILDIDPSGKELSGRWATGAELKRRFEFTAEKREQVDIATTGIQFVPNRTKLSLFELGLPQYRGKPVIIEFGASWCPPCIDSLPLLRSLYDQHHAQGLEIVTLLFELIEDEDTLRKQSRLFVETYDIPWQVIPVRGEIKPYWDIIPHDPAASSVNLPVTIFVNADGTIRDAHMGFPGPETGQSHQIKTERYQQAARGLVAKD